MADTESVQHIQMSSELPENVEISNSRNSTIHLQEENRLPKELIKEKPH